MVLLYAVPMGLFAGTVMRERGIPWAWRFDFNRRPVAQESVVESALLRSNFRSFKTAFLYTSCTQIFRLHPFSETVFDGHS